MFFDYFDIVIFILVSYINLKIIHISGTRYILDNISVTNSLAIGV